MVGAALPVLDGTPDAGRWVRAASVALLLTAAAGHGRSAVHDGERTRWVAAVGAIGLALLQARHLGG